MIDYVNSFGLILKDAYCTWYKNNEGGFKGYPPNLYKSALKLLSQQPF